MLWETKNVKGVNNDNNNNNRDKEESKGGRNNWDWGHIGILLLLLFWNYK